MTTWRITQVTQTLRPPPPITYGTFEEFIDTLEPWEKDLLQHHDLSPDPHTVSLELQTQFFAGSDGSEKYGDQGAFGWAISTAFGERMAHGMGPARGRRMDSYRAECTGLLSILRFLIRLSQYTVTHEMPQGVIGTDSQSLLDKILPNPTRGDQKTFEPVKLDELTSEWDLLIEIQEGMRMLPRVSIIHVKGHQDDKHPYDRLPLLAQLNVDADKQAGRYQNQYGTPRPFVLLSTRSGAHLVHDTGTITGKYEDTIRLLATGPALKAKIQAKYAWSDHTMRTVNWHAHGRVFRSRKSSMVHTSKLVHDCLPTHALLNKFDFGHRKCPACEHPEETRDHILRCPHITRKKWRERWWSELDRFHAKANTSPILRHIFKEAITQWFDDCSPDIVSPIFFPEETRRLIYQQNQIGWRQIFNGRFSTEWTRLQDEYYYRHRNHTKYRRTGIQWQKNLITVIWTQWQHVWKMRNDDVHGNTLRAKQAIERSAITRELTTIYDNRHHMERPVQQLLHTDVITHLQRPTWVTRNWITMNTPLIRDSLRRVREQSRQGVRTIQSYFRPVHVPAAV